jgi:hypothetical protein
LRPAGSGMEATGVLRPHDGRQPMLAAGPMRDAPGGGRGRGEPGSAARGGGFVATGVTATGGHGPRRVGGDCWAAAEAVWSAVVGQVARG